MIINGWKILSIELFNKLYKELVLSVAKLRDKKRDDYKKHPKTKLLASIQRAIRENVPANPDNKIFRLGKTLDAQYSHWRRVKHDMPPRYRMFFRFHSNVSKKEYGRCIIFVWFNNEFTLRKAGSKTDVYNVFKSLLINKTIPDNWNELLNKSESFIKNKKASIN